MRKIKKNINILKSDIKNFKNKNYKIVAKSNEYFEDIDKLKKIIQIIRKYKN